MKTAVHDRETHDFAVWEQITDNLEWSNGDLLQPKDLKYTSPRTISYLLTGEPSAGLTKRVRKNIVWKKGKKPMLTSHEVQSIWGSILPSNLGYPLAKSKLDDIALVCSGRAARLVKALVDFRALDKVIGTYYGPFLEELDATGQGHIYPKLNMCSTSTGRLSSSNPNGQNMPEEARGLVESLFGNMKEIDFKQLEVVGLAVLSQDPTLINDLMLGKDIHFESGKSVMGWKNPSDMTDKDRKTVKGVNFGLIYGGGAKGISAQTGTDVKIVKALIKSFYARYPGVADWQEDFYSNVASKLSVAGMENGEQIYHSLVEDTTSGRRFYFKEAAAPQWVRAKTGRRYSFKPTETKNYPVQGFAGGDIVMVALTLLWEQLYGREGTALRMTVHDSILVDTDMSDTELTSIMEDVCGETAHLLGISIPLKFDIQSGSSWQ
jgi:DNA polymerase-1